MNDKVPMFFDKRPIYVCLLTERSDGHLIDFRRISARNLTNGQDLLMSAEMMMKSQYISCYVMCEAVAGTLRYAELKPELPAHLFPTLSTKSQRQQPELDRGDLERIDGRLAEEASHTSLATLEDEEFAQDEINDQDMVHAAAGVDFNHIDYLDVDPDGRKTKPRLLSRERIDAKQVAWSPERLDNGKWACNHKCKYKTTCKHLCCRDGVDKAPKPPKDAFVSAASMTETSILPTMKGKIASFPVTEKATSSSASTKGRKAHIETINLANQADGGGMTKRTSRDIQNLQRLHDRVVTCQAIPAVSLKKSLSTHSVGDKQLKLSFPNKYNHRAERSARPPTDYEDGWTGSLPSPSALLVNGAGRDELPAQETSTDYGSSWHDDLSSPSAFMRENGTATKEHFHTSSIEDIDLSQFNHDDEEADVEAAMVGLSDSISMKEDLQARSAPISLRQSKTADGLQSTAERAMSFADMPTTQTEASSASVRIPLCIDSPEKSTLSGQKRKQSLTPDAEDPSLFMSAPKRLKVKDQTDAVLEPSLGAEDSGARPAPVIRPGFPAWVYEFDPQFIAEYQDFVEFI